MPPAVGPVRRHWPQTPVLQGFINGATMPFGWLHLFIGRRTIRPTFKSLAGADWLAYEEGNMASTTLGVKVDDLLRSRLKDAATRLERTPHWLIKQAIFAYLEKIERGQLPPELSAADGASAGVTELAEHVADTIDENAPHPFLEFAQSVQPQSVLRAAITAAY